MRGVFLTAVGCAALSWSAYGLGYRINITASHPYGVYRIVDREPEVGLYAIFCAPVLVAALPPLDRTRPPCTRDKDGYPMLKRIDRIDMGRGEYFVRGDHPRSLDSRIFGPLRRSDITGVAVPVAIFVSEL